MEPAPTPSQPEKRDVVVAFRLTPTEAAHVDQAAAALRRPRTRGGFSRATTLHGARQRVPEPAAPLRLLPRRLPALDTQMLSRILADVGQLGSHVGDLAHAANSNGPTPPLAALTAILGEITGIRDRVAAALNSGRSDQVAS